MSTIYELRYIIIIQKWIRRYIIKKYILIPSAYYQTKQWRKNRKWYKTGKSNECEKYQIEMLSGLNKLKNKDLNLQMCKTNDRINITTYEIKNIKNPYISEDGYEWSENFDIKVINDNTYYYNLKFICDKGGSQTRSLKLVYDFIRYQLEHILKYNYDNIYFINILDGDTSYNNMNKFRFLHNQKKYIHVKNYIFIGSLYDFQKNYI